MMNLTPNNRKTVDACRFCWMCRHICPVGNATGQERNTSRARALGLSLVLRDVLTVHDVVDNCYECMLCGACTKECMTGWDPVAFTTDARLNAALEGETPDYIDDMLDLVIETGNPYGVKKLDRKLQSAVKAQAAETETLFFVGQDARCRTPGEAAEAIALLQKSGVPFTTLENEPGSGYALYFLTGQSAETLAAAKQCAEALDAFKTVVVYDPNDAAFFVQKYKEWGVPLKAKIKTFTAFLAELVKSKKLKPAKGKNAYTFQDPFGLARNLEETVPARDVLGHCGTVREMLLNGKDTMAAGSLLMNEYIPEVMAAVARRRWDDAISAGVETLVTASPSEYACLAATRPENIKLMTIEETVLKCL